MGDLIPLFGIVFGVGLPMAIPLTVVVLTYRKRRRLLELHHAERMAAIERGMEVPPLPLALIEGQTVRRRTSLLPGLVWLFVGIAVFFSFRPLAEDAAHLGLIPAAVGLAYLIYYFIEGRKLEFEQMRAEREAARE
jgi:hypothetical protein